MRNRPRLLVAAAAATVLCAALLALVVTPLRAQPGGFVSIQIPDGRSTTVTAQRIKDEGTKREFTIAGEKTTKTGMTLEQLLEASNANLDGIGVYELVRGQQPLYFTQDSRLFFYKSGDKVRWLIYDEDDVVGPGGQGGDQVVELEATEGEILTAELTVDPEKGIRAGDDVKISVEVDDPPADEKLRYEWNIKAGSGRRSFTTTFEKGEHSVYVDIRGADGSRGTAATVVDVGQKRRQQPDSGGGSPGGGSGGGSSGGGSSGGGGGSGGGGVPPATTIPPYDSGAVPPNSTTPALPPPSTSPPSDPGRGPNLDPNVPPTTAGPDGGAQQVEGILVSANVPPRDAPGNRGGNRPPDAAADKAKNADGGIDWKAAGGVGLPTLLVLLGALTERRQIRRLLPQPQ